jgi:hypothetical protein
MYNKKSIYRVLNYLIAAVWFANGFFCKVLNLVPRHKQIVERILGSNASSLFTKVIGVAEIVIAIWIVSGIKSKINALTQVMIIAVMNTLEFFLAPDLLLWGKFNALFAFIFILVIYFNEFLLNKKSLLSM